MSTKITLAELQSWLDSGPFHEFLKMQILSNDENDEELIIKLPYSSRYERIKGTGQIHGGVISSLADIAGDFVLINALNYAVPTINLRIDYLRAAVKTDLTAIARAQKIGRTIGVADVEIRDNSNRLIAVARGCYGTTEPSTVASPSLMISR